MQMPMDRAMLKRAPWRQLIHWMMRQRKSTILVMLSQLETLLLVCVLRVSFNLTESGILVKLSQRTGLVCADR
jgi:hypothetical protein